MTLYEHWHRVTWPEVATVLEREYPEDYAEDAVAYCGAFLTIAGIAPKRESADGMQIVIRDRSQFEDGGWDTGGITVATEDNEWTGERAGEPVYWALDFTPWAEWLALPIEADTEGRLSSAEIVAHCLWEMTWHGYEEEHVQEKIEEIEERVANAIEQNEHERKGRLN